MKVLLADDHQLLRQALRRALEEQGATVVAEASVQSLIEYACARLEPLPAASPDTRQQEWA